VPLELRELIRNMSFANPLWGDIAQSEPDLLGL
jgi:hypothetical protein